MKWLRRIATVLVALIVILVAIVYGGSEYVLRRGHDMPQVAIAAATGTEAIAEGGRLARITGCRDCHGSNGQGTILVDSPVFGRAVPPALARVAARSSDAELARAIRHGVAQDGSALYIMPTGAYAHLADEDVARIIAWIRTLKPGASDTIATTSFGPLGRALVLTGALPSSVHTLPVAGKSRPADIGRYMVSISCAGCHDLHKERPSDDGKQIVPALATVGASYDPAAFRRLLRTGIGMTPRDLGMMREAAVGGLRVLTDSEIVAIQAYLRAEAEKAPSQ
ncbi:mono/diheme cytochrome c family protein [Sphingomonas sp. UYAg733]